MASTLVLNRARKVPAEDSVAFGPIAERFRRAGDLERAISLCRDGLKRFPDQLSARVTLGWALLDLGKYDDAREELEQVLRRAPDNLAAIRGLAELHDRFEHTLNLSMDGPGQWPPPPSDVDSVAPEDTIAAAMEPEAEAARERPIFLNSAGAEIPAPATITPAEMGVPLWAETPAVAADPPASDVPVADPVIRAEAAEAVATAAIESAAEPELDLDALIAEADSLELAASLDPSTVEEPTLDLSGDVDLAALIGLEQDEALVGMGQPAAAQAASAVELGAMSEEAETREVAQMFSTAVADEPAWTAEVGPDVQAQLANALAEFVGGEAQAATDDATEATSTVVFLGPRTPRPEDASEPVVLEPTAPGAATAESVVSEPAALDAVALEATDSELVAADARPEPAPVLEPAMEPEAMAAPRAAAMTQVDLVAAPSQAVVIVRLERFLRRVQARRHQLMAESVA